MQLLSKIYNETFIRYSKIFSREGLYQNLDRAIETYLLQNPQLTSNAKIINIGAGGQISGRIKSKLNSKNLKITEIDIDPKRKPDIVADIQNLSIINSDSIDVIFCLEVLEHVKNPFKAVKELHRILKPGGIFIGSTPFVFPLHDQPHDYFRYTKYGVLNLFRDFECLEIKERNSYLRSWYVLLLRLLNVETKPRKMIGIVLFPIMMVLLALVILLEKVVQDDRSTTGYFYIFRKKQ